MVRKLLIAFVTASLMLISTMLLVPFTPDKIASFFYRELTYNRIADMYSGKSDRGTIESLFKHVSKNLLTSKKYNVVDRNSFTDLIRGVGWCDQQAFILMNLLNKSNISKTRLRDVQAHTYSEVFIDGKWAIVDPFFGFFPVDENNKPLSMNDLENVEMADSVINDTHIEDKDFSKKIKDIYIENNIRWENGIGPKFIDYRAYDFYRNALSSYADFTYTLFGSVYFNWVQDIYLKSDKMKNMKEQGVKWIKGYKNYKENESAFQLFYKARNYSIVGRNKLAKLNYQTIIQLHPETYWAIESKIYLYK